MSGDEHKTVNRAENHARSALSLPPCPYRQLYLMNYVAERGE